MRKAGATLIAAMVAFGAGDVSGQGATEVATASITIPTVIAMNVVGTAIDFAQPAESDYDATTGTGYATTTLESVISTRSNVVHRLTIHANAANMSGPATATKPASHLEWDVNGAEAFTALTESPVDLMDNISRGVNTDVAKVGYRMFLDLATDEPGAYDLEFTFTAIAP